MIVAECLDQFTSRFPAEVVGERRIGIKKEFPVISSRTFRATGSKELFRQLVAKGNGWIPLVDGKNLAGCTKDGIVVANSSSICTLEISFPPQDSLYQAKILEGEVICEVSQELKTMDSLMLGYGIQPLNSAGNDLWQKSDRICAMRRNFPNAISGATITAADNVCLEISSKELIEANNVFNALAPVIIAIFANSPVWKGSIDHFNRRSVREDLWKEWEPCGQRIGVPNYFNSAEEYLRHLQSLKFWATKDKAGRYFLPEQSFGSWVAQNANNGSEFMGYLLEQEKFIWTCARPRAKYGTIEIRSACSQPPDAEILPAAFCLGVMENLNAISNLIRLYRWKDWKILYQKSITYGFNAKVGTLSLDSVAEEVLALAYEGLERRYLGEEMLLSDAFARLYKREAPAERILRLMKETKDLKKIIKKVAY
jgi:gamma-glutamylcysteine synthetase